MPLHNIDAVATNKYYVVGKMLASCLVQGGQPPVCFAHAVADYLVYDQVRSNPCIEDIPDYEVQQFMLQVWNCDVNILISKGIQYFLRSMQHRLPAPQLPPLDHHPPFRGNQNLEHHITVLPVYQHPSTQDSKLLNFHQMNTCLSEATKTCQ